MERLTIDEVVKATGGTLVGEDLEQVLQLHPTDVSIDSRTLREGDLFFAIKGERFDGHDFIQEAVSKGALAAVVSKHWADTGLGEWKKRRYVLVVTDTVEALQECARQYRSRFPLPLVAVTGTNGKTTTKDMVASVLSQKATCLKTQGNENNQIGLPLTLFRLKAEHTVAVVELGMRGKGEISRLAEICDPQIGVILNVGPAHIQFFRSVEEIAEAKGELLDHLDSSSTAFLNVDDYLVMRQRERMQGTVVTFGLSPKAEVRAGEIEVTPTGGVTFEMGAGQRIHLPVPGRHMVYNALAAIAVGREFEVPDQDLKRALEDFQPQPMRMEMREIDGLKILNDAYNANPVSMRATLETLKDLPIPGRKIAVLGDMLELGTSAAQAHREIGKLVGSLDLFLLVTVGELSHYIADEAVLSGMAPQRVHHFNERRDVVELLGEIIQEGDLVLVKGSRKMGLEGVVKGLQKEKSISRSTSVERG